MTLVGKDMEMADGKEGERRMGRFSQGIYFLSRRRRHVCVPSDGATRRDVSRCPCVVSLMHNAINEEREE